MRRIGAIFVQPDSPAFLEGEIAPDREVFDLGNVEAKTLLDAYRQHQANYSTAPFDPEGHKLRFFPGGFSIWSGFPGAGKTTLLRQLVCHLMRPTNPDNTLTGSPVFVCSMEELPEHVYIRHAEVAWGHQDLKPSELDWAAEVWGNKFHLWEYRPVESDAQYLKILAAVRVLAREKAVRHVVIDSLMCLDVRSDDYEAQRQFAGALARTCHSSGVHVHLVAHPRKPAQTNARIDLSEVAGSADLGRKADNVLFVKRDFDTEDQSAQGDCRRMKVSVAKQRHGSGFLGEIDGWFHMKLRQFVPDPGQNYPTAYLPKPAYGRIRG